MSRRKEVLGRLALVVGSVVLAFFIGELLFRALAPSGGTIRFQQRQDNSKRFGRPTIASVIEDDPELFWRLVPDQRRPEQGGWARGVISNGEGLREDHEIPFTKDAREIRLLFVGDSCTFGSGLLHHEGFVEKVELSLRSRFPESRVECINAGVPGYSLFQGWRFLETKGFRLLPDLVVLTFGWNDQARWDGIGDLEHYEALKASRPIAPLRWSRLARFLWAALHSKQKPLSVSAGRPRLTPEEFRSLLAKIQEATRQKDVELLLLVWPGRLNVEGAPSPEFRTSMQREFHEYGAGEMEFGPGRSAGCVDLVPVVQRMTRTHKVSEIFLDHVHATSQANQEIANAIVDKVAPWFEAELERGL